jgi:hypothetical protein
MKRTFDRSLILSTQTPFVVAPRDLRRHRRANGALHMGPMRDPFRYEREKRKRLCLTSQ